MLKNLKIVKVDKNYCDYLRNYDNRVSYNKDEKEQRPFIGVLFKIDNMEYFAPLSSPKAKHKTMKNMLDFFKIDNGKLGAINFNNMIPVTEKNYELINLNKKELNDKEQKYQNLLNDQLTWLNANYIQLKNKSFRLYKLYNNDKLPKKIKERCCNFKLLEEKCKLFNNSILV